MNDSEKAKGKPADVKLVDFSSSDDETDEERAKRHDRAEKDRVEKERNRTPSPFNRRSSGPLSAGQDARASPQIQNSDGSFQSVDSERRVDRSLPRKRSSSQRDKSSDERRKGASERKRPKGKIPAIPEFGTYQPAEQLREWSDWIALVYSALQFVPQ